MNVQPINLDEAERLPRDAAAELAGNYRAIRDQLPGADVPQWREWRDAAIAAFTARGLPHRRVEEWKYTDLRAAMPKAFAPSSGAVLQAFDLDACLGTLAGVPGVKLVFINGRFDSKLSTSAKLPAGTELVTLASALAEAPEWLAASLGRSKGAEDETVTLLNTAFATDGLAVRIGKGVTLNEPLHLIHLAASGSPASAALRNAVIVEEGAEATLIESYVSASDVPAQINSVTEIAVADGGRLRHYKVAGENDATQHLSSTHVRLGGKCDYLAVQFAAGNSLSRLQTFITYEGEGARAHFAGCQLMRGRQHCDMTLVVDHAAVGCESREHVKAVLEERAQGVFQAKVIVRPGAQKTDGRQMAQALLLADTAEFDAKPELEIYADDVKCNHGATSGAIDDDLMFYLRARGIPEPVAKMLLIQAFIGEILDQIENEDLRVALEASTASWLTPSV